MTATSKKKARKRTAKKAPSKKATGKKKSTTARKAKAVKKSTAKKSAKKSTAAKKKAVARKTTAKKTAKKSPSTKKRVKKTAAKKKASVKRPSKSTSRANGSGHIHGVAPYKTRRGEQYMNSDQLEHFREILSSWKRELISEINRTIHSMQDETVNHPDPNDRATQETDMSLELRSRDRERKLIKKIDDTIDLIDSGDYGYCEKCGVEVGIARLEARPTASLCIDCKTLDEIREKQMI